MATYQALIKDAKNETVLAKCSASFKKMTSYDPEKPIYTISIWIKGIRADLADVVCTLWINDMTNGPVTLTNLEYYPEKDETKFQAQPDRSFTYGGV